MTKSNVQHYLIENARQALKSGDRSAAKAALLTARYLAQKDANITYKIYLMTKDEGDVVEAANCFANIFLNNGQSLLKEDIERMVDELKVRYLKLESSNLAPPALAISSKGLRSSQSQLSRAHSLDSTNDFPGGSFHIQLYSSLDQALQTAVIMHTIETSDSLLEQSRLIFLAITLFPQESSLKPRLINTLLDICGRFISNSRLTPSSQSPSKITPAAAQMTINYARSLLVIDVLPRIFENINNKSGENKYSEKENFLAKELDLQELMLQTLKLYYDNCTKLVSANYGDLFHSSRIESNVDHRGKVLPSKHDMIERRCRTTLNILARLLNWTVLFNTSSKTGDQEISIIDRLQKIASHLDKNFTLTASQASQTEAQTEISSITRSRGRPKKNANITPTKANKQPVTQATVSGSSASSVSDGVGLFLGLSSPDNSLSESMFALIDLFLTSLTRHLRFTQTHMLLDSTPDFNKTYFSPTSLTCGDEPGGNPKVTKRVKLQTSDIEQIQSNSPIEKAREFVDLMSQVEFIPEYRACGSRYLRPDLSVETENCFTSSENGKKSKSKLESVNIAKPASSLDFFDFQDSPCLNWRIAGENFIVCVKCLRLLEKHVQLERYWRCLASTILPVQDEAHQRLSIDSRMLDPPLLEIEQESFESKITQILENMITKDEECNAKTKLRALMHLLCQTERQIDHSDVVKLLDYCRKILEISSSNLTLDLANSTTKNKNLINYAKLYNIDNTSHDPDSETGVDCQSDINNKSATPKQILGSNIDAKRLLTFVPLSFESAISSTLSILFDLAAERALAVLDNDVTISSLRSAQVESHSQQISDLAAGHLIVTSQLEWPRRSHLFSRVIYWLRNSKTVSATPQSVVKFTYGPFFRFVLNPNIIEEFMALVRQGYTLEIRQQHQQLDIDINSISTTKESKVMTTRGVNKSYKGDMRSAFEQQMNLSNVQIPVDLLAEFAIQELIPWLTTSQIMPINSSNNSNAESQAVSSSPQKRRRS